ncbi:MAG: MurR/RpiR family transcriptional regulator [Hyphomicrobiaceae bacterium]
MRKAAKPTRLRTKSAKLSAYDALREEIAHRYPGLSDRLRLIAEFALDHPTDMALGTVAEVAARAKVQPSAIVRFARAMGYGGFTELQQVFRSRLVAGIAPSYRERIDGLRRDGRFRDSNSAHELLSRFASEGTVSLENLQESVREADLARAIDLMGHAHTIYVLGLGGSYPVAAHLTYVLRRLGRRTVVLDGLGNVLADHILTATRNDAAITISFRPYNPETVRLVPEFHARGVPTIAVTDSLLSPIVNGADVVFEIPDMPEAVLRTMVAPMCLVQTLAVGLTIAMH